MLITFFNRLYILFINATVCIITINLFNNVFLLIVFWNGLHHSYFTKHACVAFIITSRACCLIKRPFSPWRLQKQVCFLHTRKGLKTIKTCKYVNCKNRKTSKNISLHRLYFNENIQSRIINSGL